MKNTPSIEIALLPLEQVDADPDQPRKRFDDEALAELATSMSSVGLLEPIIVRPVAGRFVIIAGERRTRAARAAGWSTIPAIVRDVTAADAFELSMIENIVRADMNPIEESAGYQRLVDGGMTVETIAARLGKTTQDIRFRLALLRLDEPIRDLVAAGQMGVWDAWHIARLTVEGQHRVIRAMRNGELTAAGSVRRLALAVFEQESQISAFGEAEAPATPPDRIRATHDLRSELDRAVRALTAAAAALEAGATGDAETQALADAARAGAARVTSRLARAGAAQMAAMLA